MSHKAKPVSPVRPSGDLVACARQIAGPENFFVGLPDNQWMIRNILVFHRKEMIPNPNSTVHDRFMLILNLQGEVSLLLDSRMLNLVPGQALLVFPFQSHRYLVAAPEPTDWLFITFEMPDKPVLSDLRNRLVVGSAELWPMVKELLLEYQSAFPRKPSDAVSAWLTLILLRLLRGVRQQPVVDWEPYPGLPAHRLVQRACQAMEQRVSGSFSVDCLATDLSVSCGYLRACFRRVLGMSVAAYIRRTRVYRACALLSRQQYNISEIAEQCGFSSVYAFSRAFTREIGTAPTRYRAHLWKDKNLRKG